jgi:hypothetical protein
MSKLSRRSLVSSVIALPALAVPAVASASMPTADTSQPELLALGEQLKPLFAEWQRLDPLVSAAYQQAMEDAGFYKFPSGTRTRQQQAACEAGWKVAAKQSGYSKLYRQLNPICSKADQLAKRILEIEATDRVGDGIHAAAALFLNEPDGWSGEVLRRMATKAGFSVVEVG